MSTHRQWGTGIAGAPLASSRSPVVADAAALLQAKHRRQRGDFLLEGVQGVREALNEGGAVRRLFVSADTSQHHNALLDAAVSAGVPVTVCDDRAIARLATSVNPSGVVAHCAMPAHTLADACADARLLVYLHEVSDPGNLGTIIRTADAAGADAVLLSPRSVDPFNDKALRSTAGSIFHLPVVTQVSLTDAVGTVAGIGATVLAAAASGTPLTDAAVGATLVEPTMWVFGAEAHGLSEDALALAHRVVAVPHYGRAESLNLASAVAVCVYATAMAQAGVLPR